MLFFKCLFLLAILSTDLLSASAFDESTIQDRAVLTESQIQEFSNDGFCVEERLIQTEEIKELHDAAMELHAVADKIYNYAKNAGWYTAELIEQMQDSSFTEYSISPGTFIVQKVDPLSNTIFYDYKDSQIVIGETTEENPQDRRMALKRIVWAPAASPEILQFSGLKTIFSHASQLFKSNYADLIIFQFHYKMPGDGVYFAPHQDIENRLSFCKDFNESIASIPAVHAIIALDAHTADNGPIKYVRGRGVVERKNYQLKSDQGALEEFYKELDDGQLDTWSGIMSPGDVAYLSPYTIHFSNKNKDESNSSRLTLIIGLTAVSEDAERHANTSQYPGIGSSQMVNLT